MSDQPVPVSDPDAERVLDARIDRLHAGERLRVWSIVVTIFGDAIVPRGGEVAVSVLQAITSRLRIEPGALRAALSRLAQEGWVERRRVGRRSFYRLTEDSMREVVTASRRIYAPLYETAGIGCEIAVIANGAGPPHVALADAGFARIDGGTYLRARDIGGPPTEFSTDEALVLRTSIETVPAWLRAKLSPPEIAAAYDAVIDAYEPLEASLPNGAVLSPLDAMAARTLLIHDWRRVRLRDSDLPLAFRTEGWPGARAHRLARALYAGLLPASEYWLDICEGGEQGCLPRDDGSLRGRFV